MNQCGWMVVSRGALGVRGETLRRTEIGDVPADQGATREQSGPFATEKQRRAAGRSADRIERGFHHGLLVAVVAAAVGCGAGEERSNEEELTASDVQEDLAEAGETAGEYLADERQEFAEATRSRMEDLERQIEGLRGRITEAGESAAERMREQMGTLREAADDARARLDGLTEQGAVAWEDMREGMSAALAELEAAYERAVARFEES